jgi:hypothetical protein
MNDDEFLRVIVRKDREITALTARLEAAEEALRTIAQDAEAYPEKIFTPLSAEEEQAIVDAMCQAAPAGADRMHASWGRHLMKHAGAIARAAITPPATETKDAE